MTEQINPETQIAPEPELRKRIVDPKGVLQKNMKLFLYLGAALLVIVAAVFSSTGKKPGGSQAAKNQPPQPAVQDNTDNNVAELKSQLQAEQLKEQQAAANNAALQGATPAQQAAAAAYGRRDNRCRVLPARPVRKHTASRTQASHSSRRSSSRPNNSPRRSANLPTARASRPTSPMLAPPTHPLHRKPRPRPAIPCRLGLHRIPTQPGSSLTAPRNPGEPMPPATGQASIQRGPEVNIDSAVGQLYVIYEGLTMDTVLMNRLDGDAVGPVKVLVSNPVYSHDHQHVLIPDGTIVLGEAKKIDAAGFGQQRRLAVVFHRMIMPDGYSVDLDQFHGLDQIGEEGLKDIVNNHYLQIFGTSIALGVIAGAAEITQGGSSFVGSGSQEFTNGAASSVSESATTILDRFMQIPPTITIREGHPPCEGADPNVSY